MSHIALFAEENDLCRLGSVSQKLANFWYRRIRGWFQLSVCDTKFRWIDLLIPSIVDRMGSVSALWQMENANGSAEIDRSFSMVTSETDHYVIILGCPKIWGSYCSVRRESIIAVQTRTNYRLDFSAARAVIESIGMGLEIVRLFIVSCLGPPASIESVRLKKVSELLVAF
jgi:hypothetical protein